MSELRQQIIDAVLVRGFSPRTHKSYLAAMSKTIVIAGVSAMELVRCWPIVRISSIDPNEYVNWEPKFEWRPCIRSRGDVLVDSSRCRPWVQAEELH